MNVASLEPCEELYELSGWDEKGMAFYQTAPAYDLGYLLRKLPSFTMIQNSLLGAQATHTPAPGITYLEFADTPENAACKLAVELFKQGVLQRAAVEGKQQ